MNKKIDYDLIIVGAGPAGLSFALSMADTALSVLVLERNALESLQQPQEDGREIALTHLSVGQMKQNGVWERIPTDDISPIKAAKVFDGQSDYSLDIDRQQTDLEALGFLVPNHCIRQAYYEELISRNRVDIRTESIVEHVDTSETQGVVTLSTGETLSANLVVAADTRFSEMRRKMGLSATMRDFSRTAIVCRMRHEHSHQQTAFECFHYGRTLAILPMSGNRSSVVITLNSRDAQRVAEMPEADFNHDIQTQLQSLLGDMHLIGKRHMYPLVAVHANQFVTHRFALIGDAAVGMHPVTAHGFNLGLRGQAALANCIEDAIATGKDIGALSVLKPYESAQMKVSRVLYHGTNIVVGLFTHESKTSKLLRKATLRIANNLPPLKHYIRNSLTENSLETQLNTHRRFAGFPLPPSFKDIRNSLRNLTRK